MSNSDEMVQVLIPVVEALEKLGVRYHVGGSVASSAHGIPRATLDVDLVAALFPGHIDDLVNALEQDYYIDGDMIHSSLQHQMSFNLLHLNTMLKIDIFPLKPNAFARQALDRAVPVQMKLAAENPEVLMTTAEDIVLFKLEWYELGNRVSEKQWLDILGVLKVQANQLDVDYMRKWAIELKVEELLEQAFVDAGLEFE